MQRFTKRLGAGLLAGVLVLAPAACAEDEPAEDELLEEEEPLEEDD